MVKIRYTKPCFRLVPAPPHLADYYSTVQCYNEDLTGGLEHRFSLFSFLRRPLAEPLVADLGPKDKAAVPTSPRPAAALAFWRLAD
jgi:hypothetical protein